MATKGLVASGCVSTVGDGGECLGTRKGVRTCARIGSLGGFVRKKGSGTDKNNDCAAQSRPLGDETYVRANWRAAERRGAQGPPISHESKTHAIRKLNAPGAYVGGSAECVAMVQHGQLATFALRARSTRGAEWTWEGLPAKRTNANASAPLEFIATWAL